MEKKAKKKVNGKMYHIVDFLFFRPIQNKNIDIKENI